jgi:hypothetical protein
MDIFINENKIDVTLENERTVGDVLHGLMQSCDEENATIVDIEIDGTAVNAGGIDAESQRPLQDVRTIKLRTVSAADIRSAMKELRTNFRELETAAGDIPTLLQSGRREESYDTIRRLANAVDGFCRTTTLSALFPEQFSAMRIDGKAPNAFFSEFAPILNEFCSALENNDIVMIGDLAEYEIKPRLAALALVTEELS